jgi:hypothetical protein
MLSDRYQMGCWKSKPAPIDDVNSYSSFLQDSTMLDLLHEIVDELRRLNGHAYRMNNLLNLLVIPETDLPQEVSEESVQLVE